MLPSLCQFGLARCDITPPENIYHRMWGAASHDRAEGVHRPLTATALVFAARDQAPAVDTQQVVVAVDHCLLWAREMQALLSAICEPNGLAPEQVVVSFSHTHAAGLMDWERENLPGGELIRPYLEEFGRKLADVVRQARENLAPAAITYAYGSCQLAAQRDYWDERSGQYVCGYNPHAPADDTLLATRVTDARGGAGADIVNYACHPTTLAWENRLISPDYPGAMREVVENVTGRPCVFLQGASGDLGPKEGFVGDVAVADRNGRQLGFAALGALEAAPPPGKRFEYAGPVVSGATLGSWKHVDLSEDENRQSARWRLRRWTVDMPYREGLATADETRTERQQWTEREASARAAGDLPRASDCRAMIERMDRRLVRLAGLTAERFAFPVTLWQMGDAFWLAVEGEPYNVLQTALRERFPDRPIVVSVLANGSRASYLPPQDIYGKGIYQESIAILAPGCLERLIAAVGDQIAVWTQESPAALAST